VESATPMTPRANWAIDGQITVDAPVILPWPLLN
jgi:hypothetical protein